MANVNPTPAEFNMSPSQLAALETKKYWEKVIGGKFNKNDEINQIAEHWTLMQNGFSTLSGTTASGKRGK